MAAQGIPDGLSQRMADADARNAAQLIDDSAKDYQRSLFGAIIGWKVHDIIEFNDNSGDDIIATVFANLAPRTDVSVGQRAIIQVINIEQGRMNVKFVDTKWAGKGYQDVRTKRNFIEAAQAGEYA